MNENDEEYSDERLEQLALGVKIESAEGKEG